MIKSDRILVTGAAGLMGSALVDHLRAEGYENVIPLQRADCDLLDTSATFAEFERRRPDHVFHAAARVYGIMGSLKNQGALFYDNSVMNMNVVEASRRAGVRKITVMGTGAVYPFPSPGLPLKEDMIFLGRPHPAHAGYANAKLAMLAIPACCLLWSENARIRKLALVITTATILFTGDITLALLNLVWHSLNIGTTGILSETATLLLIRPASITLFAMGVLYLWTYIRSTAPSGQGVRQSLPNINATRSAP